MRIFAQNKDMPINVNIKISNPGLEALFTSFKNQIMDAIQELSEKIGQVETELVSLRSDLAAEHQQINDKLDGLEAQNTALAEEVENLQGLLDNSEPEIAAAIARLSAIQAGMAETREEIRSIVADTPPPPPVEGDPV